MSIEERGPATRLDLSRAACRLQSYTQLEIAARVLTPVGCRTMAAVTIPLLNLRHHGPRGVGTSGAPVQALRQFQKPPPDLVAAERKKLEQEKMKLVNGLRSCASPPPAPLVVRAGCSLQQCVIMSLLDRRCRFGRDHWRPGQTREAERER